VFVSTEESRRPASAAGAGSSRRPGYPTRLRSRRCGCGRARSCTRAKSTWTSGLLRRGHRRRDPAARFTAVKKALKQAAAPLALVISNEIYSGIVCHGYVDGSTCFAPVWVRVGPRRHRGWIHVPAAVASPMVAAPMLAAG